MASGVGIMFLALIIYVLSGIKVLNEYERGGVQAGTAFALPRTRHHLILPGIEKMVRIDLRVVTLDIRRRT